MRIDHTRTSIAKARTMTTRTARKVKRAHTMAALLMVTLFPADNAFGARSVEG